MKKLILWLFLSVLAGTYSQAQSYLPLYGYFTAGGTDTYTATVTPTPAYQNGYTVKVKFTNANTGAATINLNSLGAKTITKGDGLALSAGDISAGQVTLLIYDGTKFQIVGGGGGGVSGSYWDLSTGGALTGNNLIDGDGLYSVQFTNPTSFDVTATSSISASALDTDVDASVTLNLGATDAPTISLGNPASESTIYGTLLTSGDAFQVGGTVPGFLGIQYAANYSANFTARSLIDKGYADATYASAGGYWSLATGGTLTGANTVTSNTQNQINFTGTWTATANSAYMARFTGTLTARTTATDFLHGYLFNPSLTGGATSQQDILGVTIQPTLTGGADNTDQSAALYVNPTFAGTLNSSYGITSTTSNSTSYNGLRIMNSGTGTAFMDFVAASSASLGTASHFYLQRANGTNGNATIANVGTGNLVLTANASSYTIKSGATGVSQESYGLLLNTQGIVSIATGSMQLYYSSTTGGNLQVGSSSAGVVISTGALSASWKPTLYVAPGAHTAMTAATEFVSNDFVGATQTWADGTTTNQRFTYFRGFTVNKTTTSAIFTNIYTVYAENPTAGTGVTFTNPYALGLNGGLSVIRDNLSTTQANYNGIYLVNNTAAANNAQQISPSIVFEGQGWKTAATASSQSSQVKLYVVPIQGTTNPTDALAIEHWANGSFVTANYFHRGGLNFTNNSDATTSGIGFGNGSTPNARGSSQIYQSGSSLVFNNATGYLDFANVSLVGTSGSIFSFRTTLGFAPTSGTATWRQFLYQGTINQTGGANGAVTIMDIDPTYTAAGGAVTGINYDPTVTSVAGTHLAIRTTSGQTLLGNSSSDVVTASTRLDVRSSGTSTSTYGLRIADSGNAQTFAVRDDGLMYFGSTVYVYPSDNISNATDVGNGIVVSKASAATTNVPVFTVYGFTDSGTSGTKILSNITNVTYSPASGAATHTNLLINPTYNTTGTYSGTLRGIYYNPTTTSLTGATHFAGEYVTGGQVWNGKTTPSQITSNQNDYNPTGIHQNYHIRLSSDASRDITGIVKGADGEMLVLHNVGSFNIVLKDESASSTAANRFALNADVTIAPDQSVSIWYDSTSSRWRVIN